MIITKPTIFKQFPDLIFGFSTKYIQGNDDKFHFNMSKSIGDSDEFVEENRKLFFNKIGLSPENVIIQKQIHSNIVNVVDDFDMDLAGDALITQTKNLGLAVSTADCTNIYLIDRKERIIAAVHSGWEGTEKRILEKTIHILVNQFLSNPENIYVYFGPSICKANYEVGAEFGDKFEHKYLSQKENKYLLDLKSANKDILLKSGVPLSQIEISDICSFGNGNFHSYRRDKANSGRALGVIALKDFYE